MPALTAIAVPVVIGVWLAAGILFTLGWRTRWTGGLLAAILLGSVLFDEQTYSNHIYLLGLVVMLLALADSGAMFSLDARRRGPHATVPAWPVFLLRAQLSIVYGFAAVSKLNGAFLSGKVLVLQVIPLELARELLSITAIAVLVLGLSILTVGVEALLAVWFWNVSWRPLALVFGLLLHSGIILLMDSRLELTVFALTMFALYFLFLDTRPASRVVVWDETSSVCATWVRWFRRLDWCHVHTFRGSSDPEVPKTTSVAQEQREAPLQLIELDGRRHTGFVAVGRILELLPISFLWAPLLRLPGLRQIGERLYHRYVARQHCNAQAPLNTDFSR
jgi:predicted DCC family thiol-disulfide oxidoreductase YuxK